MRNFVSCHTHQASLDTGSTPETFIERELELGTGYTTTTDHGSLNACRKVYDLAHSKGLKPILGCLMPGQEIHTIDGIKKIEDVVVGDLVLTHKGRFMPVLSTMTRQYRGDIYTFFEARNGTRGFTVTAEHPIFICGQDKVPRFQRADEVAVGKNNKKWGSLRYGYKSYIMLPRIKGSKKPTINTKKRLKDVGFKFSKGKTFREISSTQWNFPTSIQFTKDLAYFLGLYAAEGWAQENGQFGLCFNIKERNFIDFTVNFLRKQFGITAKAYDRPEKGSTEVVACHVPVAYLLMSLCGIGANFKKVPREIFEIKNGRRFRLAFLKGLLDGDGKKGDDNTLKTTSVNLVWGARLLAVDLGIFVTPKAAPTYTDQSSVPYYLCIKTNAKWRRSFWVNGNGVGGAGAWRATPLGKSEKKHYDGPVYNLEVAEDNSYVSDFIVHNCELYLRDDNDPLLKAAGHVPKEYAKYFHVTAHFQDQKAYETGCKLLSEAPVERHGSEYKPIFTWDNLEELGAQNVTMGSSCLIGVTQRHLLDHDDPKMAEAFYQKIRSMVKPKNFIVEAFPHVCDRNWVQGIRIRTNTGDRIVEHMFRFTKNLKTNVGEIYAEDLAREFHLKGNKHTHLLAIRDRRNWLELEPQIITSVDKIEDFLINECTSSSPDGDVQRGGNLFVLEMAKKYGDPVLISDDSHMATREYKVAQDVKLMAGGGAWRFHTEYFRMSSMDAWEYFDKKLHIPFKEFEGWIDNSYNWASTFDNFKFSYKPELPTKFYPENTIEHLKMLIKKHGRMKWDNPVYVDRLQSEIQLFHNNGTVDLLTYFFVYEETCSLYQSKGKLTGVGRGSAAGTLIAYLLGITHVDPIVYDLSLNRFITLDRIQSGTFPDIDLDLPSRDILVGGEKQVLECKTEDGQTVFFDKGQLVHTKTGVMKIEDAIREGVDIENC